MKQWLYYGWVTFKHWFLFTSWKFFHSKDDYYQLLKLYKESCFRKASMNAYVKVISNTSKEENARLEGMNCYIGDLKSNYLGIVDDYYKQKAEEEKPKD